ncbi:hypothetical protein TRVA0_047S00760 [Trichomonascus vanleenenianus]|uniref:phosphopantothenoylcysteine decarboxylase complex subunit SIS2 n=1 Tax=Trichomonascus vanleenenianus TaxID=2268995 RepID=UPI003ECB0BAC
MEAKQQEEDKASEPLRASLSARRNKPGFKLDNLPIGLDKAKKMAEPEPILNKPSSEEHREAKTVGHMQKPSVHAHFKLDDVVGHSGLASRSRSGTTSQTGSTQSVSPPPAVVAAIAPPGEAAKEEEPRRESVEVPNHDPRLPQEDGKLHILLGATGSASTSKLKMIINKLENIYGRERVAIQVVLTRAAEGFISPSDLPPRIIVWRDDDEWSTWKSRSDPVLHIELRRWADILVIAPLTANTLGKIALGLCDNLLTNVIRAWNTQYPILIAPAMLSYAYNHPATKRHLMVIKEDMKWIEILKPTEKVVGTFGDIGLGGMMDFNEIVDRIVMRLGGYPEPEEEEDEDAPIDDGAGEEDEDEDEDEDEEEQLRSEIRKMNLGRRGS